MLLFGDICSSGLSIIYPSLPKGTYHFPLGTPLLGVAILEAVSSPFRAPKGQILPSLPYWGRAVKLCPEHYLCSLFLDFYQVDIDILIGLFFCLPFSI